MDGWRKAKRYAEKMRISLFGGRAAAEHGKNAGKRRAIPRLDKFGGGREGEGRSRSRTRARPPLISPSGLFACPLRAHELVRLRAHAAALSAHGAGREWEKGRWGGGLRRGGGIKGRASWEIPMTSPLTSYPPNNNNIPAPMDGYLTTVGPSTIESR